VERKKLRKAAREFGAYKAVNQQFMPTVATGIAIGKESHLLL
jgi:hypothetical protein